MNIDHKFFACIRNDFLMFLTYFFKVVNPGASFEKNWHIDAMAAQVNRLIAGDIKQLLTTMPPRCAKSYIMSVALPAYLLGHNPAEKIIVVCYGEDLAEELSVGTQMIMQSDVYRYMFPDAALTRKTKRELRTAQGGRRFATTIGGAVTGLGGTWLIVDDPLNGPNAHSEPLRSQANTFFNETLATRGDNPAKTRFVVVAQRLHDDDLPGQLIKEGGWEHLKLPARATEDAEFDVGRTRKHLVREGELLHPARLDEAFLDRQWRKMGTAAFEAQYQQDPLPLGGNQIKAEWLHWYSEPVPRGDGIVVQSWDTASKTGVANDYSVCTTWLLKNNTSYLLNVWRDRVDFPTLRARVADLYHKYDVTHLLIEDAGSGMSLIQELKASSPFNVIGRKPPNSKAARVDAISGAIESGRVRFLRGEPWEAEFDREMLGFPGFRHDDQVDSVTQYVMWAMERASSSLFEADFGRDEVIDMNSIAQHILNIRGAW